MKEEVLFVLLTVALVIVVAAIIVMEIVAAEKRKHRAEIAALMPPRVLPKDHAELGETDPRFLARNPRDMEMPMHRSIVANALDHIADQMNRLREDWIEEKEASTAANKAAEAARSDARRANAALSKMRAECVQIIVSGFVLNFSYELTLSSGDIIRVTRERTENFSDYWQAKRMFHGSEEDYLIIAGNMRSAEAAIAAAVKHLKEQGIE